MRVQPGRDRGFFVARDAHKNEPYIYEIFLQNYMKCTPGRPYLNPLYSWPFRVHCVILRPKFFHFLAVCSTIVVNCFSVWEILNPPLETNLNGTSLAFCCRMPFAKHNQLCKTHGACLLKITKCETENLHLLAASNVHLSVLNIATLYISLQLYVCF